MFILKNATLEVEIIDPMKNKELLGTRFCTGGQIFQVKNSRREDLLSGPTFPKTYNTFDSQGIPDCFNGMPLVDYSLNAEEGIIIGIGLCNLKTNKVKTPCIWQTITSNNTMLFSTKHDYGCFSMTLERKITLENNQITVETEVSNQGEKNIIINWYPHPFFPHMDQAEICTPFFPFTIENNNPGYKKERESILWKNQPDENGFFYAAEIPPIAGFSIDIKHPICSKITMRGSFPITSLPMWGNTNTFSLEPYLEKTLFPHTSQRWSVSYTFG